MFKSSKLNRMHILILLQKRGGLVIKELISILGVQGLISRITWVAINNGKLIEYSLPTYPIK
jgi:hypothetical protein